MIVALLVLIVLILLFGAAAVKGWIANTAVAGCGFIAICLAIVWLGTFFGEHGFLYVVFGIGGILLVLGITGKILDVSPPPPPAGARVPNPRPRPNPKPSPPPEPPAVEKVWGWYASDISLRFSPEARDRARELYDAGDAHKLDRFCREEKARLK